MILWREKIGHPYILIKKIVNYLLISHRNIFNSPVHSNIQQNLSFQHFHLADAAQWCEIWPFRLNLALSGVQTLLNKEICSRSLGAPPAQKSNIKFLAVQTHTAEERRSLSAYIIYMLSARAPCKKERIYWQTVLWRKTWL